MTDTARDVARRSLGRVAGGEFASAVLDVELRDSALSARDRALATELTYGVLRHQSRLDRAVSAYARKGLKGVKGDVRQALRVAAYQLLFLDRVPDHAAVDDAVASVRRRRGPVVASFVNGVLRALARDGEPPLPVDGAASDRLSVELSIPAPLMELLAAAVPPERLADACAALNRRPPMWLRANALRCTPQMLVEELAAEGVSASAGPGAAVRVDTMGNPSESRAFARGACTVQDLAAQWVGVLAAPKKGQSVLDACAGVGGKTTHLAERCLADLRVHAVDISRSKLDQLVETASRLGVRECIEVTEGDLSRGELPELRAQYDLVVIDAPCTGVGVLRRHPELKWRDGALASSELEQTQRALLERLAAHVRPGGALVYAVCSFKVEEGQDQVRHFLASHPDFAVDSENAELPLARDPDGFLRTWPDLDDADAFFAARLVRRP